MTYTVSVLHVAQAAYDDIRDRITALGKDYQHMFMPDGAIDMTHVAIQPEARPAPASIDPGTGRPFGDHGTAHQAMRFAYAHDGSGFSSTEASEFLEAWWNADLLDVNGDKREPIWPEFYAWLKKDEA